MVMMCLVLLNRRPQHEDCRVDKIGDHTDDLRWLLEQMVFFLLDPSLKVYSALFYCYIFQLLRRASHFLSFRLPI